MSKAHSQKKWQLLLYIAGMTPSAERALANIQQIAEEHLDGQYEISVIDLLENPKLAAEEQIFAVPTLVRKHPLPLRKIVGDLSDIDKVLVMLDIK